MNDRVESRAGGINGRKRWIAAVLGGSLLGVLLGIAVGFRLSARATAVVKIEPPRSTSIAKHSPVERRLPVARRSSPLEQLRECFQAALNGERLDIMGSFASISELTGGECEPALESARKLKDPERRLIIAAVVQQWARADPAGAFTAALRERDDNDLRNRLGQAAAAEWVANNPEAALAELARAPRVYREKPAEWILGALAKIDPARAASILGTKSSRQKPDSLFRDVAVQFGGRSLDKALEWATSLPNQELRDEVKKAVWSGYAFMDPVKAAAEIPGRLANEGGMITDVYRSIASSWSRKDPAAALAWIGSIEDAHSRKEALQAFGPDWSALSESEAKKLIDATEGKDFQAGFASNFAEALARKDVTAALAWAQRLPEGSVRARALRPVMAEWSASDPAAAVQYAATLPPGDERKTALGTAASEWARADPRATLAWAGQLPSGKERDETIARAVSSLREDDPQSALEWVSKVEDGHIRAAASEQLIQDFARSDTQAAISLASNIPEQDQPKAFYALIRGWAFEHTTEAGAWINGLPQGKPRDAAVAAYVSVIDGMDPALATKWAQTIDDPVARPDAMLKGLLRWMEKDAAGASAWARENPFPEGIQPYVDKILNEAKNRKANDKK